MIDEPRRTIRQIRKSKGMTQLILAAIAGAGVSQGEISSYELGKRTPTYRRQSRIIKALKVKRSEILWGQADPPLKIRQKKRNVTEE